MELVVLINRSIDEIRHQKKVIHLYRENTFSCGLKRQSAISRLPLICLYNPYKIGVYGKSWQLIVTALPVTDPSDHLSVARPAQLAALSGKLRRN